MCPEGEPNFIIVDRNNILETAEEEILLLHDYRKTLEVSFFGEKAKDYGGPRKEFFRLCLREIKEKYFTGGMEEHSPEKYFTVGLLLAMSIIENGAIPRYLSEAVLQEVFMKTPTEQTSPCIVQLQKGFEKLGLVTIASSLPTFLYLLRESPTSLLTCKKLLSILEPEFSDDGSNAKLFQVKTYDIFIAYTRQVAAGHRTTEQGDVTLGHILQFVTGTDEDPPLGFRLPPHIAFPVAQSENTWHFLPTAHTCINTLNLPRGNYNTAVPSESDLFALYDTAFQNAYLGLYELYFGIVCGIPSLQIMLCFLIYRDSLKVMLFCYVLYLQIVLLRLFVLFYCSS